MENEHNGHGVSIFFIGTGIGSAVGYLFANRKMISKISKITAEQFDSEHADMSDEEKKKFKNKMRRFGHTMKEFFFNRKYYEEVAVKYEKKEEESK